MATTIRIDEVNTPETFDAERFIKDYFKPMRISKERKEEREEAAKDFRDFLLFIFALIALENEYNTLNWSYVEEQFRIEFERAALEYARRSQALEDYIAEKASDFVRITQDNDLSDPYWTSDERATYEAVNEANTVITMDEWQRAIDEGAVSKRWRTQNDSRVRDSHRAVDGHKEAINDFFHLQHGIVRFPCDFYYCPKEASGCRCGLDFLDKNGNIVAVWKKGIGLKVTKSDEKVQFTDDIISGNIETERKTDFFVGKNGNALPAKYESWIGDNKHDELMELGTNRGYLNFIDHYYRRESFIGDGGTVAIRLFEKSTGLNCGKNGGTHALKVQEGINRINNMFRRGDTLTDVEKSVLERIKRELESVL